MRASRWRLIGMLMTGFVLLWAAASAARAVPIAARTSLDSEKSGSAETTFGDLAADAVRSTGGADFALVAADELKSSNLPGAGLTTEQLSDALRAAQDPSDTVVAMRLTGSQIRVALERSVSRAPGLYAGFLQVSGLRVAYDPSKPEGSRVVTIVRLDGSPLVPGQTYAVATTRLLSDGALGYFEVWPKDVSVRNTGVPLAKSLTDYALIHQPLSYRVEGRVSASR